MNREESMSSNAGNAPTAPDTSVQFSGLLLRNLIQATIREVSIYVYAHQIIGLLNYGTLMYIP